MSDVWGSIKKVVGKVAPVLGNAILPGIGGVAGSLLAEVLGVDNEAEAINTALQNATPEQIEKIKKLEYEHREKLISLGIEQDKFYLADVQSARNREVDVVKATGSKDVNLYVLAWVIMGGFLGLILALIFFQFSYGKVLQSDPLITLLLGSLATDAGMVVGYFFGSSKSSADKTEALTQIANRGERNG